MPRINFFIFILKFFFFFFKKNLFIIFIFQNLFKSVSRCSSNLRKALAADTEREDLLSTSRSSWKTVKLEHLAKLPNLKLVLGASSLEERFHSQKCPISPKQVSSPKILEVRLLNKVLFLSFFVRRSKKGWGNSPAVKTSPARVESGVLSKTRSQGTLRILSRRRQPQPNRHLTIPWVVLAFQVEKHQRPLGKKILITTTP